MKKFTQIDKEFTRELERVLKVSGKIIISSHRSPDDDAAGSALGMYYVLTEVLGISKEKVRMVFEGSKPQRWNYFENYDKVEFVANLYDELRHVDLWILLDGGGFFRFSKHKTDLPQDIITVCLDHHPKAEDDFGLFLHVVDEVTSTSELVYQQFLNGRKIKKHVCEALFMGILGDTGGLLYITPESSGVFECARDLVNQGEIRIEELKSKYDTYELKTLKCIGEFINNLEIRKLTNWPDYSLSFIDGVFMKNNSLTYFDISHASKEFSGYLKTVSGANWGFVVKPEGESKYAVSFRSIPGSVNVRDIAERMQIGGGHDRAAGASLSVNNPIEAIKIIERWMSENKPVLD